MLREGNDFEGHRLLLEHECCADEIQPYAIPVSFRKYVGHERLSLEVGTPPTSAGATTMRYVDGEGGSMGKIPLGEQGHAMLADIDGANALIEAYTVRISALNPNGQLRANPPVRALLCNLLVVARIFA
jgi:hypothetical protein